MQLRGVSVKVECGWSLILDRVMMQTGQEEEADDEIISRT